MKNNSFARFARAFFIFWHFEDVLVISTTWNNRFCWCVDDVSIWWQMFNFVFICPKRWLQFNSRIVRTHSSSIMTLNNWKMIAETRSYIFRWGSRFRWRRVCLSSLLSDGRLGKNMRRSEYPQKGVEHMTFRLLIRTLQFHRIKGEKSEKSECPKKGVENMTFPQFPSSDTHALL